MVKIIAREIQKIVVLSNIYGFRYILSWSFFLVSFKQKLVIAQSKVISAKLQLQLTTIDEFPQLHWFLDECAQNLSGQS
jgi:hypothetical protein